MNHTKVLAFLFALSLLVSLLGACGNKEDEPTGGNQFSGEENAANQESNETSGTAIGGVVLTKVGTVSRDVSFTSGGFLTMKDDEKGMQFVNAKGETIPGHYEKIDAIVKTGICIVKETGDDGRYRYGVMDTIRGKELAPCEAKSVTMLSERFLLLEYMTGTATKDAYFGFDFDTNNNQFYFDGYGQILDLETGKLVPNLKVTKSHSDAYVFGSCIYLYSEEKVYAVDGSVLGTYENLYPYSESDLAIQSSSDGYVIYDGTMKEVGKITCEDRMEYNYYKPIDGVSDMLLYNKTGKNQLVDLNGKAITEPVNRISDVINGEYIVMIGEDGKFGVTDLKNKQIIPAEYDSVMYIAPGFFSCGKDGNAYLFDLQGKAVTSEPVTRKNGCYFETSSHNYLVLKTGEIVETTSFIHYQGMSLVEIEGTVIDVLTGETVLSDIANCVFTGDCLYVLENAEDTTYTCYRVAYAD